jgi:hypothetical protein
LRAHLALLILALAGLAAAACGPRPAGGIPPQPVEFVHEVHIEQELQCTRCHRGAERFSRAGLPPVAICAQCHRHAIPEHPEVVKVMTAFEEERPIVWRKINVLPEQAMVHFRHAPHARAGVECQECHGDVASMALAEPVRQVADMSWCVDCHQERGASTDCLACHY